MIAQVNSAFKDYFFVTKKNSKNVDRLCMKFSSTPVQVCNAA